MHCESGICDQHDFSRCLLDTRSCAGLTVVVVVLFGGLFYYLVDKQAGFIPKWMLKDEM